MSNNILINSGKQSLSKASNINATKSNYETYLKATEKIFTDIGCDQYLNKNKLRDKYSYNKKVNDYNSNVLKPDYTKSIDKFTNNYSSIDKINSEIDNPSNRIIEEAKKILKERFKNRGLSLTTRPKGKHAFITDTKEVSLKNYLIDQLKLERTKLNDREMNIQEDLKDTEERLKNDIAIFGNFTDKKKNEIKNFESKLLAFSDIKKRFMLERSSLSRKKKQIIDNLERNIKNINNLKTISNFVNKLMGIKTTNKNIDNNNNNNGIKSNSVKKRNFTNNNVSKNILSTTKYENNLQVVKLDNKSKHKNYVNYSELNNNKNSNDDEYYGFTSNRKYETKEMIILRKTDEILDEFKDSTINSEDTKKILSDHKKLIYKFTELEEKILKKIEKQEEKDKEIAKIKARNKKELAHYENQLNNINTEKLKLEDENLKEKRFFKQLKNQLVEEKEYNKYSNYIKELYIDSCCPNNALNFSGCNISTLNQSNNSLKVKYNDLECINLIFEELKKKEKEINDRISKLEIIGNKELRPYIDKRIERNKSRARKENANKQAKEREIKYAKAKERSNRVIIKGRKVMTHFKPKDKNRITNYEEKGSFDESGMIYFDN